MGPVEIGGLPAHALIVHVVVIMVPLAALLIVLGAVWPAARRKFGVITPIVALIGLISVPLATHAGEWLEDRLGEGSPLIARHASLGDTLLPWVIGLTLVAIAQWAWPRWGEPRATQGHPRATDEGSVAVRQHSRTTSAVAVTLAVLAVVAAVGSVVQTYRIGDSGAQAVWQGSY